MSTSNFFESLPDAGQHEVIEKRCDASGGYVERIVSHGQTTPDGQWYDQVTDEWVILLRGGARLQFEDEEHERELRPGDEVFIEAGKRHRVTWTDPEAVTLWLAVHFRR